MKQLVVPYCGNLDFGMCAEARIEEFGWRKNDYMPETVFRLCWNHSGLAVEAVSHETRLRMEADTDGRDVWHDSCMEFFFGPAEPERRYINLEVNPKGTIVMGFGSGKVGRVRLEEKYKPYLGLSTEIREAEGLWLARYLISFKFLSEVFGGPPEEARFRKFYANFYKCGEMTEFPHYGMWSKIDSPAPDFHRPEFFGELRLVE
ncbi:MAG: carbohydrate-binding family 9-like protein [Hungatella hathewayi]|nr:carbohydrate-binding family 9-like protein [Hungatella hathewayi]